MRFLSVFLPRLPTDRILRQREPVAAEAPFALWRKIKGGERLVAVNAPAQGRGLLPGMAVADARALYPALALEENDAIADVAMLEAIADWVRRFTPLAALDPPYGVLLDVTGAAQLFGGEANLLDEIECRLASQGFCARTALAPGPALARALARFSNLRLVPGEASQKDIDALAAKLPVSALELEDPVPAAMARAGLRNVGDLLARPRAPLAARFGRETLTRLDALTCRIRDPITPRFEAPDYMAERRFPEGLTQLADIEATLERLAEELRLLLERGGVGARTLEAVFYRVDGVVKRVQAGTSRPLRDPARIFALLRERLALLGEDGLDTGYGFDVLRLCASAVERLDDEQRPLGLEDDMLAAFEASDLADLVDRLGARLGLRRVLRLYPQDAHLPEFAIAAIPATYPQPAVFTRPDPASPDNSCAPMRPLRLFEQPEPIEAVALLPDGPPLRFRWRRAVHETVAYEGPERIAPRWWRAPQDSLTRDYFNVVDSKGRRFWIYREGLLGQECAQARWFMHGLF
jgi:protein ImuB